MSSGDTNDPKLPGPDKTSGDKSDQDPAGEEAVQAVPPKPGPTNIPEQPDNLRRRQDWFHKRS